MKILVTAFDPFGGSQHNSSLDVLNRLPDVTPGGHELVTRQIPVVYDLCGDALETAVRELSPDAVVCLGQAAGRNAITPEYIAVNVKHSASADNSGQVFRLLPIEENAPDGIISTLPVLQMTDRMKEAGIPASVSFTAGAYVCNNLMYRALRIAKPMGIPAGFIHLPLSAEIADAENKTCPSIPLDTLIRGILICLDCL